MRLAVLFVCLLAGISELRANGWEHAAIDFDDLVAALRFEHPETRRRAADSLGYRGDRRALPELRAQLERPETNPYVRQAIYVALGRLKDADDAPRLEACLGAEALDEVRAGCAQGLGRIAAPRSRTALLELVRDREETPAVSAAAVLALSAYPEPEVVATLGGLTAADEPVAAAAVAALGNTQSSAAVPYLLKVLEGSDGRRLRELSLVALGLIGDPAAKPALLKILGGSSPPALRIRAAGALAAVETGSADEALIGLLNDPLPAVQLYAIRGLHRAGARSAGQALAARAKVGAARLTTEAKSGWQGSGRQSLRDLALLEAALRALADLDPDAGSAAMLETARLPGVPGGRADSLRLADSLYRARRAALYGLGYAGGADTVAVLSGEHGLQDPDPRLRAVAARSLGVAGDPAGIGPLVDAFRDSSAEVRWTAARVLGLMNARQVSRALRTGLHDASRQVRFETATALGLLRDTEAEPTLLELAGSDPEERVRAAARLAVERIQSG